MPEFLHSLLHSIETHHEAWGVIGTWFAGLSTFAAAFIALWLGIRSPKPRMKLTASFSSIVGRGVSEDAFIYRITNHSVVPQKVTGIGFEYGIWRWKQHFYTLHVAGRFDPGLPRTIEPHASSTISVTDDGYRNFVSQLAHRDLKDLSWLAKKTVRFTAFTAVDTLYARPNDTFWSILADKGRLLPPPSND
ncbi:MAG: hypothetical protein NXI18_19500 [Alphaproteobacteria bacterium]|nr:hypothetical protein [Alphaproteobacteria bacterium]